MKSSCHPPCRARCCVKMLVGALVLGLAVMLLWNWLMPALFAGVNSVNYLQAIALLLLARILAGGYRGGHGHCHSHGAAALSDEEKSGLCCGFKGWGKCKKEEASEADAAKS